jgi:hypothetical protein
MLEIFEHFYQRDSNINCLKSGQWYLLRFFSSKKFNGFMDDTLRN